MCGTEMPEKQYSDCSLSTYSNEPLRVAEDVFLKFINAPLALQKELTPSEKIARWTRKEVEPSNSIPPGIKVTSNERHSSLNAVIQIVCHSIHLSDLIEQSDLVLKSLSESQAKFIIELTKVCAELTAHENLSVRKLVDIQALRHSIYVYGRINLVNDLITDQLTEFDAAFALLWIITMIVDALKNKRSYTSSGNII